MLSEETGSKPDIISLSPEADRLLEDYANEIEPKILTDYADMTDWVGKLIGNTLRISGLLCRAQTLKADDFLDVNPPLVVEGKTMENAINLSRYYLNHAPPETL